MELRHLTYFGKVAELGSISKAADVLRMTQPALSRQIKDLERELDYRLFHRTSRGVELTQAGIGLYRHLGNVFAEIGRIPEVIRTMAENKELIRIGVPQGLPQDWLARRLHAVEAEMPQVSLSLQEASTAEQRQLLRAGLIDLALVRTRMYQASDVLLLKQKMGIAVPNHSPLARSAEFSFSQLDGLSVMAHAVGEIAAEEIRLRSASAAVGAEAQWVFRKFSEYGSLIARTAKVDAVLLTRASARRHLPDWTWISVSAEDATRGNLDIRTWATWNEPATPTLLELVHLLKDGSENEHDGS